MVITGLMRVIDNFEKYIGKKKIAVLCHAASVDNKLNHIIALLQSRGADLRAIFGPQHGLFGQTQDNMIEWEGEQGGLDPFARTNAYENEYEIRNSPFVKGWREATGYVKQPKVYSLYGETRTPTDEMLSGIDMLVVDLQDVGARPYTYIWTMKECAKVCEKLGIEMLVLDRPNPIGFLDEEGAVLEDKFFSFVGGANIKMAHKKTIGEIAKLLKQTYFQNLNLQVVEMLEYDKKMRFEETGLPWILPSPNMPTTDTAIVYPGQVLLECTNVSEGRGTCKPFEFFGAPFIKANEFLAEFEKFNIEGTALRRHDFSPTFNKYSGFDNRICGKSDGTSEKQNCIGFQIHVTDLTKFKPVKTSVAILKAIALTSPDEFSFNPPPYEYEYKNMPIDIVWGNSKLSEFLKNSSVLKIPEDW